MNRYEFENLVKHAKATSIKADYDIEITFDNGVIVTIGCETDYDSSKFTFDTNIEEEQRLKAFNERKELESKKMAEQLRVKNEFIIKYGVEAYEAFMKI